MHANSRRYIHIAILSAFSTAGPFASVSSAYETYRATERSYIISAGQSVAAFCRAGDVVISGSCHGVSRAASVDEPKRHVYLDSAAIETPERNGWNCKTQVLHANQIARVSATATCLQH